MTRRATIAALVIVASAIAATGYWAGRSGVTGDTVLPTIGARASRVPGNETIAMAANVPPSGVVVYYRHPDGDASYSASPATTEDGRDFIGVTASEDVSFEQNPSSNATDLKAQDEASNSGDRKILYYRNPMGLPDTSPVPKLDSMGMDYLPVYEGEDDDGSTVKVSAGKLQRTGVKTVLATRSAIIRPVNVPGTVVLDERRISVVSIRAEAFIEEVSDITSGSAVSQGQPLVRFYAKEIAAAGALYASDLKTGGKASARGSLQRLENLGVPKEAIAEIETTGRVPISVTLTAPRGGVVLERMAIDGMMSEVGETLFKIADISTVWVEANVPEYELSSIRVGATATIRVRSLPGREFNGKVELIFPAVQEQTRTAKVRIELANPDGVLFANMYADVEIEAGGTEPVVVVPDSAVIDTGDRQVVIVDRGEGSFEPRDVKIGMRGGGMTEIMDGVAAGDRIVVSANFLIDAESNLKAALGALGPAETQP